MLIFCHPDQATEPVRTDFKIPFVDETSQSEFVGIKPVRCYDEEIELRCVTARVVWQAAWLRVAGDFGSLGRRRKSSEVVSSAARFHRIAGHSCRPLSDFGEVADTQTATLASLLRTR